MVVVFWRMLYRHVAGLLSLVDALPPCCWVVVFGGCFATVLQFKRILGRRGCNRIDQLYEIKKKNHPPEQTI
jgi:hypothetical protein